MADVFTTSWDATPVRIDAPSHVIAPAPRATASVRAAPGEDRSVRRCFVNDSLNSRVVRRVQGVAGWQVRWRTGLPPMTTPICLLTAGDRIVLQALSDWSLWTTEGRSVASGPLVRSGVALDPQTAVYLFADHAGLIVARRLDDGQRSFAAGLSYGSSFARTFVARRGQRLFTVSLEMAQDPHAPEPENTMLEVSDLGDPANQKSFGQPDAPVVTADLIRETRLMVPAMLGDTIVVAVRDWIYSLDLDLHFHSAITGSFTPRFLSLDEAGRIYLLADASGRTALWQLSPRGERYYAFVLPSGVTPSMPAIVGYDHTAYVIAGSHIFSVAGDGKLNWSRAAAGVIAGAAATPDDLLVVSEGSDIAAYDARGERRTLHSIRGEQITTAPVFTASGDLLVATGASIYCLTGNN